MPSPATPYDLIVLGGGINGCGIARDAAGRGLSVLLAEQGDLASGTSQWSTKLLHGGLRYLEHYAFRLVREALQEREVVLKAAPHVVWPLRFVLPHDAGQRPAWLLRLGLFLYDHLGGREVLPASRGLDLTRDSAGVPLQPRFRRGFEYSDCWADDARLVVLNAMDADERGADIRTRTRCTDARIEDGLWQVTLQNDGRGEERLVGRALVVATGPWLAPFARTAADPAREPPVRLIRGSHIVTRRLFDHDRAYIFQSPDGRIVFAIPYEGDFTLIGTTDEPFTGDPSTPRISDAETDYLLDLANRQFRTAVTRADIVWSYSGVRQLYDDGASAAKDATRDYVLALDTDSGAPRLAVYGGKITTFRRLAEHALGKLASVFPGMRPAWTAGAPLPGGDFPVLSFPGLVADLERTHPFLGHPWARRLARLYGTRAQRILGAATRTEDLGIVFGADLTEAEVAYLRDYEWARTAEDVLWRRTKLGLRFSGDETASLRDRMGG